MKVKICGLTRVEDALAAIEAGADMLGFNFYRKSRRALRPSLCRRILRELHGHRNGVLMVGVFVNSTVSEINRIMSSCGLDLAQLHGDEPPETLVALEGRAFKAVRPQSSAQAERAVHRYSNLGPEMGPALLLDAHQPGRYGGTGNLADWTLAKQVAGDAAVMLAGGLTPMNVRSALNQVMPWGVDVASGVESAPGYKNPKKIQEFVRVVRSFEREVVEE